MFYFPIKRPKQLTFSTLSNFLYICTFCIYLLQCLPNLRQFYKACGENSPKRFVCQCTCTSHIKCIIFVCSHNIYVHYTVNNITIVTQGSRSTVNARSISTSCTLFWLPLHIYTSNVNFRSFYFCKQLVYLKSLDHMKHLDTGHCMNTWLACTIIIYC